MHIPESLGGQGFSDVWGLRTADCDFKWLIVMEIDLNCKLVKPNNDWLQSLCSRQPTGPDPPGTIWSEKSCFVLCSLLDEKRTFRRTIGTSRLWTFREVEA